MIGTVVRRRLPRAERESQLVDVAEAIFAERGFREASMEEIALRAGVTKPVLYDHFGSKDGLVAACIRRSGSRLFASITAAVDSATGPAELLAAGLAGFFDFIEAHGQAWFTLVGESAVVGEAAVALEAIRREQAEYVAQMLSAQLPGVPAVHVEVFAEAIIGACERIALWRRDAPSVSVEEATAGLMTLVWGGLEALTSSSTR